MKNRALASRYARALAQTLTTDAEFEATATELDGLSEIIERTPQLRTALENPAVISSSREAILNELRRSAALSQKNSRFLDLMAEHGRLGILPDAVAVFRQLRDERLGIVEAELTTAVPIDGELEKQWQRKLGVLTGRTVRLRKRIDPAIIGGAVARIGSKVYDGSLRSRLSGLRERMIGG